VADHTGKKIVWGAPGKDTATLDMFFAELGPERSTALAAVSMDMGTTFAKAWPPMPRPQCAAATRSTPSNSSP
jgi:transposase